jgi:hypothetical protein
MGRHLRQETELYAPLRAYLEGQGYQVHAEVGNCDLIARNTRQEVIAIELKSRLSLDLVIQAVRRKELTEAVYLAVPLEGSRGRVRNLRGVKELLRRLEMGLIAVRFLRTGTRIEVLFHPKPFQKRTRRRPHQAMLREIDGRFAEFDSAGQPSRQERLTAYKQQALLLAAVLREQGEASPARLRSLTGIHRAGELLSGNVYGWFERVRRGVYRLHPDGVQALDAYAAAVNRIRDTRRS